MATPTALALIGVGVLAGAFAVITTHGTALMVGMRLMDMGDGVTDMDGDMVDGCTEAAIGQEGGMQEMAATILAHIVRAGLLLMRQTVQEIYCLLQVE